MAKDIIMRENTVANVPAAASHAAPFLERLSMKK
jgi:hypothetical protein